MKIVAWHYLGLFLAGIGLAQAECERERVNQTGVSDALAVLIKTVMSNPSTAPCGSLTSVLNKLASRGKTGGRRLETDKPLDIQKAQQNLTEALNTPEIRTRVEKMRGEVKDENERLVYEAAILDEEGYYDARELKIHQLQQKL